MHKPIAAAALDLRAALLQITAPGGIITITLKRSNYLKEVKKDYNEGKLTGDEAFKSFTEQYNIN